MIEADQKNAQVEQGRQDVSGDDVRTLGQDDGWGGVVDRIDLRGKVKLPNR